MTGPDEEGDQRAQRRDRADLRVELLMRQEQHRDRHDVRDQAQDRPEPFAVAQLQDVDPRERGKRADQDVPGQTFALGQRRGEKAEHEGPGEAGVRDSEEVFVEILPRDPRPEPEMDGRAEQERER
jgi:hypothetical protein